MIEQSELDASDRGDSRGLRPPGGRSPRRPPRCEDRAGAAGQAARRGHRRAARPVAALGACGRSGNRCSKLADKRQKSPQHESRWFNLAGFFLRPGRGFPLDDLRIKALWPIFHQGVKHTKDVQCWAEWWILWRQSGRGAFAASPRGNLPAAGPFSAAGQGNEPRQEGRPAQARSPRAGRNVAVRRQPRAHGARDQGTAWAMLS